MNCDLNAAAKRVLQSERCAKSVLTSIYLRLGRGGSTLLVFAVFFPAIADSTGVAFAGDSGGIIS